MLSGMWYSILCCSSAYRLSTFTDITTPVSNWCDKWWYCGSSCRLNGYVLSNVYCAGLVLRQSISMVQVCMSGKSSMTGTLICSTFWLLWWNLYLNWSQISMNCCSMYKCLLAYKWRGDVRQQQGFVYFIILGHVCHWWLPPPPPVASSRSVCC